ncbi:MAG: hypothetical protein IT258_10835 [Saprospiraceae bacterium]|nr:hypothetical protein [Saprospiraceae bacterium]
MKLSDIKDKIDAYFDSVSPIEIVKRFEALGYEFEEIEEDNYVELHASKINRGYKPFSNQKGRKVSTISAEIQGVQSKIEFLEVQQISSDPAFTSEQFKGNYGFAMAA